MQSSKLSDIFKFDRVAFTTERIFFVPMHIWFSKTNPSGQSGLARSTVRQRLSTEKQGIKRELTLTDIEMCRYTGLSAQSVMKSCLETPSHVQPPLQQMWLPDLLCFASLSFTLTSKVL